MTIDVERARAETPGCGSIVHFNNAGASLPPQSVTEAMINHLRREAWIGGYEAEAEASDQLELAYFTAARLFECDRSEIALVENATRAWDMAFYGMPLQPGDRVLTCMAEYSSNYIAMLHRAQKVGASIEVIPNDETGALSVDALESLIDSRVKLIAITHVGMNGGMVNPAEKVGAVARAAGVPYLLDATQSVGQMPVLVSQIGCDMLCATGRKYLRGPRGTGLLYVSRAMLEHIDPPFLDNYAAHWSETNRYTLSDGARRFETWEGNVAARIGLGVAMEYAMQWGLEAIQERITLLADEMRVRLASLPGVAVHDTGAQRCGIVTFTVEGRSAQEVRSDLGRARINVWVAGEAATRLDMQARGLRELVRASVHYYNTTEEIDALCAALA